jgi:hypothetical protein
VADWASVKSVRRDKSLGPCQPAGDNFAMRPRLNRQVRPNDSDVRECSDPMELPPALCRRSRLQCGKFHIECGLWPMNQQISCGCFRPQELPICWRR